MKTLKFLSMLAAAFLITFSFSSCGDDEEAPEINHENPDDVTVGNLSIAGFSAEIKYSNLMAMPMKEDLKDSLDNVIMPLYDKNGNRLAWCEIRLSSWDRTENWEVPEGHKSSSIMFCFFGYADKDGEYIPGEYQSEGGGGSINEDYEACTCDVTFNFEPSTIKVERGADNVYTLTIPMKGEYYINNDWETGYAYSTTFKYVGTLVNMQQPQWGEEEE